jgi:hypothetical protein
MVTAFCIVAACVAQILKDGTTEIAAVMAISCMGDPIKM